MSYELDGTNPLAYMGVKPSKPPQMLVLKKRPTNTDNNFNLGTLWLIPQSIVGPDEELWFLADKKANVAVWKQLYPGAGAGTTDFETDAGTATEIAGQIKILGGTNINTLAPGAADIVQVNLNSDVTLTGFMRAGNVRIDSNAITSQAGTGINIDVDAGDFTLESSTGTIMTAFNAGAVVEPFQPAFSSSVYTTVLNVTGDGTVYRPIFNIVQFDQSGSYDSTTGVFTAPVTGKYMFFITIRGEDIGVAHLWGGLHLQTTYADWYYGIDTDPTNTTHQTWNLSKCVKMDVGDTAYVKWGVNGGTKTVDIAGGTRSYFSGALIC